MDLKSSIMNETAIKMNQIARGIRLHEQELKVIMMEVKDMMTKM